MAKAESRREVAERIAQGFRKQLGYRLDYIVELSDAIEKALRNRDERAANTVEGIYSDHPSGRSVAAAIRNEDTK